MNKGFGKITTFLLLILVSVPVCCPFILLLRQQAIQKQSAKRFETIPLHDLLLNRNKLQWVREGKELIIDGRLFDVKSVAYYDDGLVKITGLFDDEESQVVEQYKTAEQKNNSNNGRQLVQILQLQLAMPEEEQIGNIPPLSKILTASPLDCADLPTSIIDILTPPPRI